MELLLELLGQFLALPLLLLLVEGTALILACLGLSLEVLAAGASSTALAALWKRHRRLRIAALSVVAFLSLAVLLLNTVLFESTLRSALSRWKEKTGTAVEFQSARGNWLSGRVELTQVRARRAGHDQSNYDLTARSVTLRLRMTSLLGGEASFESVEVAGLRGTYERRSARESRRHGRDFAIDRLTLSDAAILFRDLPLDEKPAEMRLALDRLDCAPFRRRFAVFDALFRASASGTIDGAPFTISSEGSPAARTTRWHAADLPLRFLADYAGGGFAWFRSGRADVDVADSWNEESREIDSHWRIGLKSPVAHVPDTVEGWKRPIAEAAAGFINRHPAGLPLEFDLRINRDEFDGALSVEASGLLSAVGGAFARRLAELAEVPVEKLEELRRRSLEAFRRFLDRWRKK